MDALWDDSNIIPRSPKPGRTPLFLPSPSASPEKTPAGNASNATNPDLNEINSLFASIDDLEVPSPRQNKRTSESGKNKQSSRPSAVNVLLSDEDDEAPAGRSNDTQKGDEEKKARKKPIKLDENRLLGKTGFPALIEQHRRFKPSAKGNEAKDLKRLLEMYQFWAVKMYPRSDFRETAEKVEKLCRSRRMQNALNSFKKDLELAMNGPRDEITEDMSGSDDDEVVHASKALPAPVFDSAAADGDDDDEDVHFASSQPSTSMSLSATASDLDDLIAADLAERRAALERDRVRQSTSSSSSVAVAVESRSASKMKTAASGPVEDDWDLDALLAEENEAQAQFSEPNATTQSGPSQPQFDVDVDVDIDLGMDLGSVLPRSHLPGRAEPSDEDEEMWDMVHEIHAD